MAYLKIKQKEKSAPKARCLKCHFATEQKYAFPRIPRKHRRRLLLEHQQIAKEYARGRVPHELLGPHADFEDKIFKYYLDPKLYESLFRDHQAYRNQAPSWGCSHKGMSGLGQGEGSSEVPSEEELARLEQEIRARREALEERLFQQRVQNELLKAKVRKLREKRLEEKSRKAAEEMAELERIKAEESQKKLDNLSKMASIGAVAIAALKFLGGYE